MARLARFADEHPGIELELVPSGLPLDLSRREADIAIRVLPAGSKPPEYLIGRHLCPLRSSTYVHRGLHLSARLRALREVIAEEFAKVAPQLDTR